MSTITLARQQLRLAKRTLACVEALLNEPDKLNPAGLNALSQTQARTQTIIDGCYNILDQHAKQHSNELDASTVSLLSRLGVTITDDPTSYPDAS